MAVDWDTLATTGLGAATTVLGIVIGGFVGRRSQDRQRVLDTRSAAYATFLREYAKAEIDLREAYTANRPNTVDWDSFNGALVALSLVAPQEVSAAVRPILEALGELCVLIVREPKIAREYQLVHEALSHGQIAFVNAARRSLDSSQGPLDWVMGGPPAWSEVERWLPAQTRGNSE
ncbi:hypothetical protein ACFVVX_32300 [Kitasatospora sp. NPDC058170]|uniref:hypothetical protein n=1 Tax=Kitasatospora sp. NPDC058170 TaxID=3346364 RepID=UPI0036DA2210